jgi:uncharacterized protein YcbX
MFQISELNLFPVKSLGGCSIPSAHITATGFEYDRRWMLTDKNNKFLTQREFPAMALLAAAILNEKLHIQHKYDENIELQIPLQPEEQVFKRVEIFSDYCKAQWVSKIADDWFSEILKINCQLVYMPEATKRLVDGRYAKNKETTTFTDGYPILIIGQESLTDLNSRMLHPLPMDRYRPNIVFTGGQPYEEDLFEHFNIGSVEFIGVKRCGRCIITTIDQQSLDIGKEPLKTLATYRSENNKIYFGKYLLHRGEGIIQTGEHIILTKKKQDREMAS